jgi:methyltransferase (TIGR00027 family)
MIATATPSTTQSPLDLSDVETTALLTLYARALESRSPDPILADPHAERIAAQIDDRLSGTQDRLLGMLRSHKIDPSLAVHIALRAQKYDQYAQDFLSRHPAGVVASLGCGLDTRFQRIDNGQVKFFDIDLPAMIRFKRGLLPEISRYRMLASSVFDYAWMEPVATAAAGGPVLFLAEGLLMYLDPDKVRQLVLQLQRRFPGCELACEVVSKRFASGSFGKITAMKMQRRMKLGKGSAFTFGVASPDEMESWNAGIQYLERWSYFESNHPKLGWMRLFRHIKPMNNVQYTVRYRLG